MKNNMISILLLQAIFVIHPASVADDVQPICTYNTYNGELITLENILHLSPCMPSLLQQSVDDWFAKPAHTDFIVCLTRLPDPFNAQTFKEKNTENRSYLDRLVKEGTIRVMPTSTGNYVLHPQHCSADFIIKIPGLGNRMENLLWGMGVDLDAEEKKSFDGIIRLSECNFDYSKMDPYRKTCLAIGRVAHSLKLKEAKQLHGLKHIEHRDVYPYHIPNQPLEVNDSNYLTIEYCIPGIAPFKEDGSNEYSLILKARIDLLTVATLREIYLSIREAGMWDTQPKNLVIDEEGNVMHLDEEPSGRCPAKQFFYQQVDSDMPSAYALYIDSVTRGIATLHNKIAQESQKAYLRELFVSDIALIAACKRYKLWPAFKGVPN